MLWIGYELKKTLHEVAAMELDEFESWIAFFRKHDPRLRDDARFAGIQATLHQGFWPRKEGFSSKEFMPPTADEEPPNPKDVERKIKRAMGVIGM